MWKHRNTHILFLKCLLFWFYYLLFLLNSTYDNLSPYIFWNFIFFEFSTEEISTGLRRKKYIYIFFPRENLYWYLPEVMMTWGHVQLNCFPDDLDHKCSEQLLSEKHCPLPNIKLRHTSFLLSPSSQWVCFNTITLLDFRGKVKNQFGFLYIHS